MCSAHMPSEFIHTPINLNNKKQHEICESSQDDLREVRCKNKNNQRLIEVLKTEIECGWGSGASAFNNKINEKIIAFACLGFIFLIWI